MKGDYNVEIPVEVNIEDVYSMLDSYGKKWFIQDNLDQLGTLSDIVDLYKDEDIEFVVEDKLEYASDHALMEEIKKRKLID